MPKVSCSCVLDDWCGRLMQQHIDIWPTSVTRPKPWLLMTSWHKEPQHELAVEVCPVRHEPHKTRFNVKTFLGERMICLYCIWNNMQHHAKNHNNISPGIDLVCPEYSGLTHWGRDDMKNISHATLSNVFSSMKIFEFRLKFHWSWFPRVQLTIFQHWFR